MIDVGSGPPVVLIPGAQGRWEWMRPTVDALAARCRVVTASLAGDPASGWRIDPARGFDGLVDQIDALRERAGLDELAVCGVSFGGLVALRYAARNPGRVTALVLVSAPGPSWRPSPSQARYVRAPHLLAPLFVASAPVRLVPEIRTAFDGWGERAGFIVRHSARVLASPMSPSRMSERVRLAASVDFVADCAAVRAPTLVVTGEPRLDRVVPVASTCEYVRRIGGARHVTLERTGHLGTVTRPLAFARIVSEFVEP